MVLLRLLLLSRCLGLLFQDWLQCTDRLVCCSGRLLSVLLVRVLFALLFVDNFLLDLHAPIVKMDVKVFLKLFEGLALLYGGILGSSAIVALGLGS